MVLLRLIRIPIMSSSDQERIILTDLDSGQTLEIPPKSVTFHETEYKYVSSAQRTTDLYEQYINSGILSSDDLSTIFERPRDNEVKKRYTGHRKIYNVNDIGIHILEKISKRGK